MKEKIKKGIHITKLDAALRQLETAIILWFNNGDSLSIHTLVSASYQIIYDLNKHQKGPRMTPDSELIKPEKQQEFKRALKEWANFMKHADTDPAKTIFFNPEVNEYLLFDAVTSYSIITKEIRPILHCFRIWFIICHPDIFFQEFIERVNKALPVNEFKCMNRGEFFQHALPIVTRSIITGHKNLL